MLHLLEIIGLLFTGGLLLAWVAYMLYRELRADIITHKEQTAKDNEKAPKSLMSAVWLIVISDVTMSLDNVLSVAGAAHGSTAMLVFGLVLSVVLMGVAAGYIANLMERHHWIGYVGVVIIAYVALDMIYRGSTEIAEAIAMLPISLLT